MYSFMLPGGGRYSRKPLFYGLLPTPTPIQRGPKICANETVFNDKLLHHGKLKGKYYCGINGHDRSLRLRQ